MTNDNEFVTMYDIVCCDRNSGRRKVLSDRDPIRGRYPAQAEVEKLQRSNRDPNVVYTIEKSSRVSIHGVDDPEGLLTHRFRAR
jgi:hypothetical protein